MHSQEHFYNKYIVRCNKESRTVNQFKKLIDQVKESNPDYNLDEYLVELTNPNNFDYQVFPVLYVTYRTNLEDTDWTSELVRQALGVVETEISSIAINVEEEIPETTFYSLEDSVLTKFNSKQAISNILESKLIKSTEQNSLALVQEKEIEGDKNTILGNDLSVFNLHESEYYLVTLDHEETEPKILSCLPMNHHSINTRNNQGQLDKKLNKGLDDEIIKPLKRNYRYKGLGNYLIEKHEERLR